MPDVGLALRADSLLLELASQEATGCLTVIDPEGDQASVWFRDGLVYAVSVPGRRPLLGVRLMSSGALTPEALAEERRLMYVGITRARKSLAVSVLRRRKRGREMVMARPSRFVDEMRLDDVPKPADPRAALAELRARMAAQVAEREAKTPKEPR